MKKQPSAAVPVELAAATSNTDLAFVAALRDVVEKQEGLRDAILTLMRAVPSVPARWLETMTDPRTANALGRVELLAAKNAGWTQAAINLIADTLRQADPGALERFLFDFVEGKTSAEMDCACGACNACQARQVLGDAQARDQIETTIRSEFDLNQAHAPVLLDQDGRRLN
jgi:hypothetical protein